MILGLQTRRTGMHRRNGQKRNPYRWYLVNLRLLLENSSEDLVRSRDLNGPRTLLVANGRKSRPEIPEARAVKSSGFAKRGFSCHEGALHLKNNHDHSFSFDPGLESLVHSLTYLYDSRNSIQRGGYAPCGIAVFDFFSALRVGHDESEVCERTCQKPSAGVAEKNASPAPKCSSWTKFLIWMHSLVFGFKPVWYVSWLPIIWPYHAAKERMYVYIGYQRGTICSLP